MVLYINKQIWYSENELLVMLALNGLYKHGSSQLITTKKCIGTFVSDRFLNTKNKKDRTLLSNISNGIDSLATKGYIDIISSSGDQIIFGSKNLTVNTNETTFTMITHEELQKIFKCCNNPVKALEVFVRLVSTFNNRTGGWSISIAGMCDNWGMSNKTVIKYLKELEDNQLIKSKRVKADGTFQSGAKFYSRYESLI